MRHSRSNKAYCYGGDQIDEHGQSQCQQHDDQVFGPYAVDQSQNTPINDVPTNFYQDACKNGMGNWFHILTQAQQQRQQQ